METVAIMEALLSDVKTSLANCKWENMTEGNHIRIHILKGKIQFVKITLISMCKTIDCRI